MEADKANATTSAPAAVLRLGAQGPVVAGLQRSLTSWGFSTGPVDGVFGASTAEALRALQRKLGVPDTGELTASARQAIKADLSAVNSKLKKMSTALVLRVPQPFGDLPATPTAQIVGADEKTGPQKWVVAAGLSLLALYFMLPSKHARAEYEDEDEGENGQDVVDGELVGIEEIQAELDAAPEVIVAPAPSRVKEAAQAAAKARATRDPKTGRFLKRS